MAIDTAIVAVSLDADTKVKAGFASTQDALDVLVTQLNDQVAFSDSPTLTTPTLTTPTVAGALTSDAAITVNSGTAPPAGGSTSSGIKMSSTANFGIFHGSGAPTLSSAQGSFYMRTDGSGTNDRMYVNTDGGTTWTAVVTAT